MEAINDLKLTYCDKGFNCDEIEFNHFVNFIHSPTKVACNIDRFYNNNYAFILEKNNHFDKALLRKSFSDLTENEKKRIIENYPILLNQFEALEKLYLDKCLVYDKLLIKFEEIASVQGEIQALDSGSLKFLKLYPSHKLTEKNIGDDHHFRLAESQFYRLIYGTDNKIANLQKSVSYKVSCVDYVVNSKLLENFKTYKAYLLSNRGPEYCKTVLGFHGTKESNIESICQHGFLDPTHSDYQQSTDTGYYGRGIYFSQYPTYAMRYIHGCKTLLLCQILLGRVFSCDVVKHGQNCEAGYDSHCSPNANELVVFNSDQILPRYIVHFDTIANDLDVTFCPPSLVKYNSKFDLESRELLANKCSKAEKRKATDINIDEILDSAKRIKQSRLLEDVRISAQSPYWSEDAVEQIENFLTNHGAIIDNENFSIFVTDQNNVKHMGESFRISMEKNLPCLLLSSLLKMLGDGKCIKDSISDYLLDDSDI